MKSITSLLLCCLLFALTLNYNVLTVEGKRLVRGEQASKTLKHYSMHARQLMMEDKDKEDDEPAKADEPEVLDPEEPEEPEEDNKDKDKNKEEDDETDEPTAAPTASPVDETAGSDTDGPVETDPPTVIEGALEDPDTNTTSAPTNVTDSQDDAVYTVALKPFTLTVDGAVEEDDLDLETYIYEYLKQTFPNLVDVDLEITTTSIDGEEDDMSNSTRRSLRAFHAARILVEQTFYVSGNATFEGGPEPNPEDVDAALTAALEDAAALAAHITASVPEGSNVTVTEVTPSEPEEDTTDLPPTGVETEEAEATSDSSDDGLSTTGLSIVIVAACVGGISLLIILMVGLSGPSGNTSGMKGGLPEQPLN